MTTLNNATDTQLSDDAALDALLSDLGDLGDMDSAEDVLGEPEIIEEEPVIMAADDALIDEVLSEVSHAEATHEMYAAQVSDQDDSSAPLTKPEDIEGAEVEEKAGKGKKKKAADKEPKEPKEARPTRVTHKPGDLLMAKLGTKANDYLTFNINDADDADAAQLKRDAFIARMNDKDAIAVKVKEKIVQLITWLDKGGELNEVMKRAFVTLHKDGELTSGDKGNLHINLLSKPYSQGTARSQGCQMFLVLPELELVIREKGKMIANPDSALLPIINHTLGLA